MVVKSRGFKYNEGPSNVHKNTMNFFERSAEQYKWPLIQVVHKKVFYNIKKNK